MPVSNNTVLPANGLASSARQASGMRLASSGAIHFAHIARGALPNIAPPSSCWLLPRIDQSFIAVVSVIAWRHGNAAGCKSTSGDNRLCGRPRFACGAVVSPQTAPTRLRRTLTPTPLPRGEGLQQPRLRYGEDGSTFAAPTGLRGSVPPDSVFVARSHSTVCRLPQTWL